MWSLTAYITRCAGLLTLDHPVRTNEPMGSPTPAGYDGVASSPPSVGTAVVDHQEFGLIGLCNAVAPERNTARSMKVLAELSRQVSLSHA